MTGPIRSSAPGPDEAKTREIVRLLRPLASRTLDATDTPSNPSLFWRLVNLNPAIWRGIIVSVLAVLATLGLIVSDNTSEAIVTAVFAVIALIQAISTHGAVTANQKVIAYKPDPVNKPSVVVSGDAISTDVVAVANAAAMSPNSTLPLPFPTALNQ